jgi:hypothetical protein
MNRAPGTDFYSTSWVTPSNGSLDVAGNMVALDVLNAAFSFLPANSTAQNGTITGPEGSKRSQHTLRIVGGVVGGVVGGLLIAALVLVFYKIHQRKRRSRNFTEKVEEPEVHNNGRIEPYTYHAETGNTTISEISVESGNSFIAQRPPIYVGRSSTSARMSMLDNNPILPSSQMSGTASTAAAQSSGAENANESTTVVGQAVWQPDWSTSDDVSSLLSRLVDLLQARGQPISEEGPPRYEW